MINYAWMKYAPHSDIPFYYSTVSPDRVIPYGDYFLSSWTFGNYDYFKTNTGHFRKLHNGKLIEVITESEYNEAFGLRVSFVFCARLTSPQAGLTRGSKRTFSDSKEKIASILAKYKDGIK